MNTRNEKPILTLVPRPGVDLDELIVDGSEPAILGRSSRCQVRLPANSALISRVHATLTHYNGTWYVVDQSRRGTFVNGQRAAHGETLPLNDGDTLTVGDYELIARYDKQSDDDHAGYTLSERRVDLTTIDASSVLRSALELPVRLGAAVDDAGIFAVACHYLVEALSPVIATAYVTVATADCGVNVVSFANRSELARVQHGPLVPIVSRRLVQRLLAVPDAVLFLQRNDEDSAFSLTLDAAPHALGASLLEMDGAERHTILYVIGDVVIADRDQLVAQYLRLTATLVRQHLLTQRRAHLAKYFSPQILQLLTKRTGSAAVEGEPQVAQATTLFFDVRGSSVPLGASADHLADVYHDLRAILSLVTEAVFEANGTIIDYAGDAVLAVWGVPLPQEDHADRAVVSALSIVRRLNAARFRTFRAGTNLCGLGLAAGEVLVGPVGSAAVFKYGVFGPSVNAAQRLAALTKPDALNRPILMASSVKERLVRYHGHIEHVAEVALQGMNSLVDVYEPRPYAEANVPPTRELPNR
ncbi:MAG: hypothetical protein RL701_5633 [Pseudomonadota bacterium]|jgi:class 3 adenylate cyclase